MLDSDGDGTSNGDELGDETCSWSEGGGAPDRTVNITHPGINEATYDNTPSYDSDNHGQGEGGWVPWCLVKCEGNVSVRVLTTIS